jgi:hypothetical protein
VLGQDKLVQDDMTQPNSIDQFSSPKPEMSGAAQGNPEYTLHSYQVDLWPESQVAFTNDSCRFLRLGIPRGPNH